MEKAEKWMLGGTLVLAIIVMETILFGGLGLGVVAGVVAYFVCLGLFSKLYNRSMSKLAKWLMVPIVLCTLCFVIFGNTVLRVFNLIFLAVLILLHALEVFGKCEQEAFLPAWIGEVLNLGITLPFAYISKPVVLVKDELGTGQKKNMKVVGKVLLGLVIAVPMLLVVVGLLASADAAFEGTINFVFQNLTFNFDSLGTKLFFVIVLFFMFFSYFYGLSHKEVKEVRQNYIDPEWRRDSLLMEDKSEGNLNEKDNLVNREDQVRDIDIIEDRGLSQKSIYLDFVVVSTIATMLCLVYLIFCLSQLAYFVSAFNGVLPAGFDTQSEYARRGFFETLPIVGFNLLGIMFLSYVVKQEKGKKSVYIKGMISFITGFTAFMVTCALSKMFMYMQRYGLSLWRVYVAWFLILSLVVVILVFAKVFWQKLQLIKIVFIVFIAMYLGLNYSNVDYLVARQNVSLYKQGKTSDLSGCYNLSSSALGPISELVDSHPEILEYQEDRYYDTAGYILSRLEYNLQNENWQAFNLADYKGRAYLEKIKAAGYESSEDVRRPIEFLR